MAEPVGGPPRPFARSVLGATVLAVCAGLAACSSAGPTSTGRSPVAPSASAQPLSVHLLRAVDLSGYHATSASDAQRVPLPCAAPSQSPLLTRFPPTARASATFESTSTNSAVREVLLRYRSGAAASSAFAGVQAGYGCASGTLGSATASITRVGQVSAGGQRADRWNMTITGGTYATAVLGQAGTDIVLLTFVADQAGADESDPGLILLQAMDRLAGR